MPLNFFRHPLGDFRHPLKISLPPPEEILKPPLVNDLYYSIIYTCHLYTNNLGIDGVLLVVVGYMGDTSNEHCSMFI